MTDTLALCACGLPLLPIYNGTVTGCTHCDRNVCRVIGCDLCRTGNRVRA